MLRDRVDRLAQCPSLAEVGTRLSNAPFVAIPLPGDGQAVGVLALTFEDADELAQLDRDLLLYSDARELWLSNAHGCTRPPVPVVRRRTNGNISLSY